MFSKVIQNIVLGLSLFISVSASAQNHASVDISADSTGYSAQSRQSYNFGVVWLNTRQYVKYTVTNTGDEPLTFKQARISGSAFDAYHNCGKGLQPKEKCNFTITFWPAFSGLYSGTFVLSFVQDQIIVDLWGEGRRM